LASDEEGRKGGLIEQLIHTHSNLKVAYPYLPLRWRSLSGRGLVIAITIILKVVERQP
jgi:hypothetical protein